MSNRLKNAMSFVLAILTIVLLIVFASVSEMGSTIGVIFISLSVVLGMAKILYDGVILFSEAYLWLLEKI